jgi:protocatechuate 3,4-dioxygenase beta subunit
VTIKDKGAAGVVVSLRLGDMFNFREATYLKATTDPDGYYKITNVGPGTFTVTPSAPAFVTADSKDAKVKTVLVGEDENVDGINFTLVRGGVITGRVTDADGRPVIEQQVAIYTADAFEKRLPERPIIAIGGVNTDDRGVYRVFGLNAGRYKVAVGRSDDSMNLSYGQERSSYRQVFHPDVTDQAKATIVEVSEGSEATNVDITLGRALQTFNASGIATDGEKGTPVPNLRFTVQRFVGERPEYMNAFAISNSRGEFVIEGLIPGRYRVYMFPNQPNDARADDLTFDITDQDVTGLTLRVVKGASITGVVFLETEDKTALAKLADLQIRAFATTSSSGMSSSGTSQIGPDGSFRLGGLASGNHNFQLGAPSSPFPPKGFSISRIERDGIVSRGIDIKEGEQVTGVRVVLSYGTATIRGLVKVENGSLPEGARIFVRMTKPGEPLSMMRPIVVDNRGRFLVEGLSPGTYELLATIVGIPTSGPPKNGKREVTVQGSETIDVSMTIDMGAPVKP